MNLDFKKVASESILNLRHKVLRAERPFSTAHFDADHLASTHHYVCLLDNKIVGCVSFMKKPHDFFKEKNAYQLRGMAVEENHRGLNIGNQLLAYGEIKMKSKNTNLIWCNVRTSAEKFYTKNYYLKVGDVFEIRDVGPHILMYKKI